MEIIRKKDSEEFKNSDICSVVEYSFIDKSLDLGVSTITGRYPDAGFSINLECKMLIYILEGTGRIVLEDKVINYRENDAILLDKNEKYYWDTAYSKVSMVSNPAWNKNQYRIVD